MSIDLTKYSLNDMTEQQLHSQHVWPLKIVAESDEEGLSSKIFVFHAEDGDDPYQGDVFECVASVQQMVEIPEDESGIGEDGNNIPYFRSEVLQFNCRSEYEAEELWAKVQVDVKDLLQNFRAASNLTTVETVTIE